MPNKNNKKIHKKILIVEDDLPTLEAVSLEISKKGIHADTALNGEEAIEKIKREKYDLILLDLLLPKKSGFEVIKEVRADAASKNIKIVVFSNLGQNGNVEKAVELGADKYFIKSDISIKDLIDEILKNLWILINGLSRADNTRAQALR